MSRIDGDKALTKANKSANGGMGTQWEMTRRTTAAKLTAVTVKISSGNGINGNNGKSYSGDEAKVYGMIPRNGGTTRRLGDYLESIGNR